MKKLVLVLLIGLLIVSCGNEPVSKSLEGNDIEVEFMFEKDGVKVYRFYDGRYHYFTTRGETITTQTSGSNSNKKYYDENIK